MVDCVVNDNLHKQEAMLRVTEEDGLVEKADAEGICTFLMTGPHFLPHEHVFRCLTCMEGNAGCCRACKDSCHVGHNVEDWDEEDMPIPFFCDCALNPNCWFADRIAHDVTGRKAKR